MMKLKKQIATELVCGFLIWFYGFFLVFDLSSRATSGNQEFDEKGREVAFGPQPHWLIARPSWKWWRGTEWPLVVWYPHCRFWLAQKGLGYADADR